MAGRCESWTTTKAECWRIDAFELRYWRILLGLPCTARRSNQSILMGPNKQPWIFFGRIDAEAPILWPPDARSQLIGKDPDAGKEWRQDKKGMTEDEMVEWHHQYNGHEFQWTLGGGKGQGSLACHSPWGRKQSDMTEWVNSNHENEIKWNKIKGIQIRKEVKLSVFTDDIKLYIERHKSRDIDKWNRLERPDVNPCIYSQLFTIKKTRIYNRKKDSFFH